MSKKFTGLSIPRKPLYAAVVGGLMVMGQAAVVQADSVANPLATPQPLVLTSCSPCAAKNPCNPCAAKKANPCNPCAAKNPCNPCAAKKTNPCNPCAAKNPCNPCNPCAAKNKS